MLGFLYILKNPSQIYWSHESAANHPPGKDPFQTWGPALALSLLLPSTVVSESWEGERHNFELSLFGIGISHMYFMICRQIDIMIEITLWQVCTWLHCSKKYLGCVCLSSKKQWHVDGFYVHPCSSQWHWEIQLGWFQFRSDSRVAGNIRS